MATIASLAVRLGLEPGEFTSGLRRSRSELRDFVADVDRTSGAVEKFGTGLAKIGAPIALLGTAAPALSGIVAVAASASGALAILPGVLGVGAAAMGTMKLATQGFSDALANMSDPAKFAESLSALAPEAARTAVAMRDLQPAWKAMQQTVQNNFFQDFPEIVQDLGRTYIPLLRDGLGGIATEMGKTGKLAGQALMEPQAVSAVNAVLGNTTSMFHEMMPALGDIIVGFTGLAGVASSFLPAFGSGIADAAAGFRDWVAAGVESGRIHDMIAEGLAVLGDLAATIRNIGSIIGDVFGGIAMDGATVTQTLRDLTAQAAAWTSSAEGQALIADVWTVLRAASVGLSTVLPVLADAIGWIASTFASLPGPVQQAIGALLGWSTVIGLAIARFAPLVGGIVKVVGAVRTFGPVVLTVVKVVSLFGARLLWLGAQALLAGARIAAGLLVAMGPVGWIIAAVVALVALIIANWETVAAVTTAVWTAITTWLGQVWQSVIAIATTVWGAIVAFFASIWAAIQAPVMAVWNAIVAFLSAVWEVVFTIMRYAAAILLAIFFTIWNPLSELVMTIWNAIVAFLSAVWSGIVSLATTAWNAVVAVITTVWNAIVAFLTPIVQAISAMLSAAWTFIVGVATTVWNAVLGVITSVWNAIVAFLTPIVQAISSAITAAWNAVASVTSSVWNAIAGLFTSVWNAISGAVSAGAARVWDFLTGLWNRIRGVAGEAIGWLVDAGRNIVLGLWNGIAGMGNWLWNQIMGWIKSVVPGPVLQFLGIASPSKWMANEVGRWIPEGLADGIIGNAKVVTDAARDLAAAAAVPVQASATVGLDQAATDFGMTVRAQLLDRAPAPAERPAAAAAPVVNLNVYNPVGEPTTVTVNKEMQLLSAIGAFRR